MTESLPMFDLPQMLKEREALRARLDALEHLIHAASRYQASARFPANPAPLPGAPQTLVEASRTSARAAPIMQATEKAVSSLLEQKGKPVQLNVIITHLFDAGVPLPAGNTANVVSARLSNSKKFRGRRGLGWWFADRPWPDEETLALAAPNENEAPPEKEDASDTAPDAQ